MKYIRNTLSRLVKTTAGSLWKRIRRIPPATQTENPLTEGQRNKLGSLLQQTQESLIEPPKEIKLKIVKLITRDFILRPALKLFNYGLSTTLMINIMTIIQYLRELDNADVESANFIIMGNFAGWLLEVILLYVNNIRFAKESTTNRYAPLDQPLLTEITQESLVSLVFINAFYAMGAGATTMYRWSKSAVFWSCTAFNAIIAPRIFIRHEGYGGHQLPLIISGDSKAGILLPYFVDGADTALTYAGTIYNILRLIPNLLGADPQLLSRLNPYAFGSSIALGLVSTGLSTAEIITLTAQSKPDRAIARTNTLLETGLPFFVSYGLAMQMITLAILASKQEETASFSPWEYTLVFGLSAALSLPHAVLAQQQNKLDRKEAQKELQFRRTDVMAQRSNREIFIGVFSGNKAFRRENKQTSLLPLDLLPRATGLDEVASSAF
jgi:hypothetical protein